MLYTVSSNCCLRGSRLYLLCLQCFCCTSLKAVILLQVSVLKNWKESELYKLNGIVSKAEANLKVLKSLSRYGEFTLAISVLLVKEKQLLDV